MTVVDVDLGDRSYPIHIGSGLLSDHSIVRNRVASRQIMIVSNETVAPLYSTHIEKAFHDRVVSKIILPDGEQFKTLDSFDQIISGLLEQKFARSCTLVALGGGVVGDITGYSAACSQRGIHVVQIPAHFLATVDSFVCAKIGVTPRLGNAMNCTIPRATT